MSERSEYQAGFSREELPLVMGSEYALRWLRRSYYGPLIGAAWGQWHDGENIAVHRSSTDGLVERSCEKPFIDCTCGFYGAWNILTAFNGIPFSDLKVYRDELGGEPWYEMIKRVNQIPIVALAEHYGETVIGELGLRSRKARLRKIYVNIEQMLYTARLYSFIGLDTKKTWTDIVCDSLREKYSSAEVIVVSSARGGWAQTLVALEEELADLRKNNAQNFDK